MTHHTGTRLVACEHCGTEFVGGVERHSCSVRCVMVRCVGCLAQFPAGSLHRCGPKKDADQVDVLAEVNGTVKGDGL